MKKASLVVSPFFEGNKIFNIDDSSINRDDCLHSFYLLKLAFERVGYSLSTSDINLPSESDIVIYNEMPATLPVGEACQKSFLLLFESALIRPDNWKLESHQRFRKIFTWNDEFVNQGKYFKINFSHKFPDVISVQPWEGRKLCTLIAGNKKVSHDLELYSKRREAIDWFEHNHPEAFDFYGIGWDKYYFSGLKIIRALNRVPILGKLLAPKLKTYKGTINNKREVLGCYRFSICYENARDIPGYITEKIFDSFFAGCVPVYWGAGNIKSYIPEGCFIDKRNFSDYSKLYDFLSGMSEDQYEGYIINIRRYMQSSGAQQFRGEYFANKIVDTILNVK